MHRWITAAALAATALAGNAASAQDAPPRPPMMGDGITTRDEAMAAADRQFGRMDADGNGQVTKAERDAARDRMRAAMGGRPGMPPAGAGNMPPPPPGAGAPPAGEGMAPPPPGPGPMGGRFAERMMERVDTNHDGMLSRDEYRAQAAARFDRMDANHDGRIDQAERDAIRQRMEERRGGPEGGDAQN